MNIGIDVGSTYTKYCVMKEDKILHLSSEKTPVQQKEYFSSKIKQFDECYSDYNIISCGYGKNNASSFKRVNELVALAKGSFYLTNESAVVLDIGGQDTKIIVQKQGVLTDFFVNDRCAAGSGLFLNNCLNMLNCEFKNINLIGIQKPEIKLSSVCAIFAQTEIVEMIAKNVPREMIIYAAIWQILIQAKQLLKKVDCNKLLLSGGLTNIPGMEEYAENALGKAVYILPESSYMSAIGCCFLL